MKSLALSLLLAVSLTLAACGSDEASTQLRPKNTCERAASTTPFASRVTSPASRSTTLTRTSREIGAMP